MLSIAPIVTLNTNLLKNLSVDEVLQYHPIIDPHQFVFKPSKKVKPIKVKPLNSILVDQSVAAHVLLATLEGAETLRPNAFVCWGVDNDLWLQDEKKLHAKYNLMHVDADGWIHCEPKAEQPVWSAQVTKDGGTVMTTAYENEFGPAGGFSIVHPKWGDERVIEGKQVFLQYGVVGDFLCKGILADGAPDHNDIYRVSDKFWKNTYEFI